MRPKKSSGKERERKEGGEGGKGGRRRRAVYSSKPRQILHLLSLAKAGEKGRSQETKRNRGEKKKKDYSYSRGGYGVIAFPLIPLLTPQGMSREKILRKKKIKKGKKERKWPLDLHHEMLVEERGGKPSKKRRRGEEKKGRLKQSYFSIRKS